MTSPIPYIVALWILWILQFALFRPKRKGTAIKTAPNARWGLALQTLGYWMIYLPAARFGVAPIPFWRLGAGVAIGVGGIWLASAGVRHLGKQWRISAALNDDHELIVSGPYRIVRHPIYASMLAMNVMSALMMGRLPWWPIGVALFIVGIEIRVRVEDSLLKGHFGARFEEWKRKVPAYLPPFR